MCNRADFLRNHGLFSSAYYLESTWAAYSFQQPQSTRLTRTAYWVPRYEKCQKVDYLY
jgi:hypothetical protein